MKTKPILSFIFIILIITACNTVEPPTGLSINLTLEDVSCTEVWINLTTANFKFPAAVELKKNGNTIKTLNLQSTDSLIYINSLLPNTSYQYQASSIEYQVSSNDLRVTTLDTTSQNFSFETWTFGGAASSSLRGVAIINANNIWAVGEIYVADTSINGYTNYNAVHWDGSQWELKRIPYYYQGQPFYHPIQSVFTFGSNDIWFCGNGVIHWDGNNFDPVPIPSIVWGPYQMNKLWGSSSDDIYVVGNNGNIARYNNGTWSRINSSTNLNINDIWGTVDNESNQYILCTAYDFATGGEKKLLQIRNFVVDEIPWVDNRELYTVWFNSKNKIYAGGEGLFNFTNGGWSEEQLPPYFIFSVRGNNHNNIIAAGGFGFCAYYNGVSWEVVEEVDLQNGNYESLAVKDNTVALVGFEGNAAVITIGTKL